MKKANMIAAAVLLGALLTGCAGGIGSKDFAPAGNSLYLTKDGAVQSAQVKDYTEGNYLEEELKAFAEKEVIEYNQKKGASQSAYNDSGSKEKLPAALELCRIKDKKATLIFSYGSIQDMIDFSELSGDHSNTVKSVDVVDTAAAQSKGYLTLGKLVKADGSEQSAEAIAKESGTVALIQGAATIQTEGKILYRTEGVTLVDDYTVTTPGDDQYVIVFK